MMSMKSSVVHSDRDVNSNVISFERNGDELQK